jgi:hypothetical protein
MQQRVAFDRSGDLGAVIARVEGKVGPPPLLPAEREIMLRRVDPRRRDIRIKTAVPGAVYGSPRVKGRLRAATMRGGEMRVQTRLFHHGLAL